MRKPSEMFVVIHDGKFIEAPATPTLYTEHLGAATYWTSWELATGHAVPGDLVVCIQDIYDAIKAQHKGKEIT